MLLLRLASNVCRVARSASAGSVTDGPSSRLSIVQGSSSSSKRELVVKDLWCSSECTPACQAGGRGFKSRQVRSLELRYAGE